MIFIIKHVISYLLAYVLSFTCKLKYVCHYYGRLLQVSTYSHVATCSHVDD